MTRCIKEGVLRALLDGELARAEQASVRAHLAECHHCQQRLAELEANSAWVFAQIEQVSPRPGSIPATTQALARLEQKRSQQSGLKERINMMFKYANRRWPALVALALVILVGASFTLEPVRVAAQDILSIFRVREFAVIPFGPEQMDKAREIGDMLEQNYFLSDPSILIEPEVQTVATSREASELAGFSLREPTYLPAGLAPSEEILVSQEGLAEFEVDLELARSLFDTIGLDPTLLPDSLGEQPLTVELPSAVTQSWQRNGRTQLTFVQGPSPTMDYPDDVDPAALARAGLQLLGMDEREADRLSRSIDWTNTLVLPLPTDISSFREVAVDGTSGLLISADTDEPHSALMWQKGDVLYLLQGNLYMDALLEVANSIQ